MQRLIALTDNNSLLTIDPQDLSSVTPIPVTGIQGTLIGIDTRPATGEIYGLTTANQLYTLNPDGFSSGDFSGQFTLNAEEAAALLDDGFYLNLHTAAFNGGELRGQLDIELENDIVAFGLPLEESQQVGDIVPPADGPGMGSFDVIYDDATNRLTINGTFSDLTAGLLPVGNTDVEGNPQSAIHLHQGAAGENGPIVRNFTVNDDGTFTGTFTLTDAEEALLLDQAFYVNLHSDTFGGGELRGQVAVEVDGDVVELAVPIEESQQVGAVVPDGPATGAFDVFYEATTGALGVEGSFAGLSGPLLPVGGTDVEGNPQSPVHLHLGAAGENGPIVRNLTATDDVATLVSTLSVPFAGGVVSGFDFNPVADRLRLVGDNDQNFRINVETGAVIEDGTLAFAASDINAGVNPNLTASAYTNSFAGTTSTALYNIDPLLDQLLLQSPPNDGTLVTVGDLGVDFDVVGGFDIFSTAEGDNAAFAVADSTIYAIDLETGAATRLGALGAGSGNLLGFVAMANPMVGEAPDDLINPGEGGMELPIPEGIPGGPAIIDNLGDLLETLAMPPLGLDLATLGSNLFSSTGALATLLPTEAEVNGAIADLSAALGL